MGTVVSRQQLLEVLHSIRNSNEGSNKDLNKESKKVVFTNGCFDILHIGHVRYLKQAKTLGDVLVVGMNSDASVKRLKGPNRPIQCEQDRSEILSSLECVDYVCLFEEDTPFELIRELLPDVLVKGGDWPTESIVGYEIVLQNGGQVLSLDFVEGRSSTAIINKSKDSPI